MSTLWYLVCKEHNECCEVGSNNHFNYTACSTDNSEVALPSFALAHRDCALTVESECFFEDEDNFLKYLYWESDSYDDLAFKAVMRRQH
jgi:hypothetical protein